MELRAVFLSIPICVKTREGSRAPEEHADPCDAAMPAMSNCMRSVSPSTPKKAIFEVLEILGPSPLIAMLSKALLKPFSKWRLKSCKWAVIAVWFSSRICSASAIPRIPARFSVPARSWYYWPPPVSNGEIFKDDRWNKTPIPLGAWNLCPLMHMAEMPGWSTIGSLPA